MRSPARNFTRTVPMALAAQAKGRFAVEGRPGVEDQVAAQPEAQYQSGQPSPRQGKLPWISNRVSPLVAASSCRSSEREGVGGDRLGRSVLAPVEEHQRVGAYQDRLAGAVGVLKYSPFRPVPSRLATPGRGGGQA